MATEIVQIQLRRDTAAGWAASNPVLADGEVGVISDSDPKAIKIGDGETAWEDLETFSSVGAGTPGPAGADGATWSSGTAVPTGGNDGDFYLKTDTEDVYKRTSGTWSVLCNIKGSTGAKGDTGSTGAAGATGSAGANGTNGATWTTGTSVPTGGSDGDLYLKTDTQDVYKRTSGTWSIVCNIKGATGATGAAGAKGDTGNTGATGAAGPSNLIHESGGPTDLTVGAIPDKALLVRSGNTVIGATWANLPASPLATLTPGSGAQSVVLDYAAGAIQQINGNASGTNATITESNMPVGASMAVTILQGAVASTVTAWPGTVTWSGLSAAPVLPPANESLQVVLQKTGSGTYLGTVVGYPLAPAIRTYTPGASGAATVTLLCAGTDKHKVNGHASGNALAFVLSGETIGQELTLTIANGATASTVSSWFTGYTVTWRGTGHPTVPVLLPEVSRSRILKILITGANTLDCWSTAPVPATRINAQTGTTYTLALADMLAAGTGMNTFNNASPPSITIPNDSTVDWPINAECPCMWITGAGQPIFVADTGVTIEYSAGLHIAAKNQVLVPTRMGANLWRLIGANS